MHEKCDVVCLLLQVIHITCSITFICWRVASKEFNDVKIIPLAREFNVVPTRETSYILLSGTYHHNFSQFHPSFTCSNK